MIQSRDAKSCVSQASMSNKSEASKCPSLSSLKRLTSKYAQLSEVNKCLSLPNLLHGRRKILRLYWADAIIVLI